MKNQCIVLSLLLFIVTGCITQQATIGLQSLKDVYTAGEPLEFRVAVTAHRNNISIVDSVYLTHWLCRAWEEPNNNPGSGAESWHDDSVWHETCTFSKPLDKWSKLPCVVIEYEALHLFETDCYGMDYSEMTPTNRHTAILSINQTWNTTRTVQGKMLHNFANPGKYVFRATLNQSRSWTNSVVGISSKPIIVEIGRTQPTNSPYSSPEAGSKR